MQNERSTGIKRLKRAAALILALIVGLSFPSFQAENTAHAMTAGDFTDVAADYWGYPYIDFSAGNIIINGYPSPDGTFQFFPENSVTREEAMAMLYRALSAAGKLKSTEDFSEEYADLFTENMIADWAKLYVAYGLKYGLLTEDELSDFTDESGLGIPAPREQVAFWTAKTMERTLSPAWSLNYVDKESISPEMLPYIDLLYRQGIMQGDDTKMFHPADGIKRVEFAAISNRVFEAAGSAVYSADKEIQSYRGAVVSMDQINYKIMMTQSDGAGRVIQINPKTQIVIDGKVNYNGLAGIGTGTAAVVAWGAFYDEADPDDGDLQLHVITKTQARTGLLKSIKKMDEETSILEIENEDGDAIYYVLNKDSRTERAPKKGKEVTFIADGVKILEMK
ncbi:MAG TPA: S-layer homology domain-containing protein [Anaerovoracaceae bacterium]|nr:S-layer homology domain-containing protein [Anaerovoracaceae bacterium]